MMFNNADMNTPITHAIACGINTVGKTIAEIFVELCEFPFSVDDKLASFTYGTDEAAWVGGRDTAYDMYRKGCALGYPYNDKSFMKDYCNSPYFGVSYNKETKSWKNRMHIFYEESADFLGAIISDNPHYKSNFLKRNMIISTLYDDEGCGIIFPKEHAAELGIDYKNKTDIEICDAIAAAGGTVTLREHAERFPWGFRHTQNMTDAEICEKIALDVYTLPGCPYSVDVLEAYCASKLFDMNMALESDGCIKEIFKYWKAHYKGCYTPTRGDDIDHIKKFMIVEGVNH